jgi:hypothetical protein
MPVYSGLLFSGTVLEIIVKAPLKRPAAPRPATTRPQMNIEEDVARPQRREPSSKRRVKVRYVY